MLDGFHIVRHEAILIAVRGSGVHSRHSENAQTDISLAGVVFEIAFAD